MGDEPLYVPELLPLFPLPHVVMFPGAILPLHVFEPRYRALTADALLGERIIGVPLLRAGYEASYSTLHAPIYAVLGVGQILDSTARSDGTYDLTLRGIARVRVLEELPGRPYRFARCEVIEASCNAPPEEVGRLRTALRAATVAALAESEELRSRWERLFESEISLGDLADLIAAGLPISAELRQELLILADAAQRSDRLISHLQTLAALQTVRRTRISGRPMHLN